MVLGFLRKSSRKNLQKFVKISGVPDGNSTNFLQSPFPYVNFGAISISYETLYKKTPIAMLVGFEKKSHKIRDIYARFALKMVKKQFDQENDRRTGTKMTSRLFCFNRQPYYKNRSFIFFL